MEAKGLSLAVPQPFELSVRIRHPSIDPAEISRKFGIEAEYAFRAGDPRTSRRHPTPPSVHMESYWLGPLKSARHSLDMPLPESSKSPAAPERHVVPISTLTGALSLHALSFFKHHEDLLRRVRAGGGEISLLVAISPAAVNNFNLAPETTRVFGELGITVEFQFADD